MIEENVNTLMGCVKLHGENDFAETSKNFKNYVGKLKHEHCKKF